MEMLEELRAANLRQQEKNALRVEIQKQFEQISRLKEEKEDLLYKLRALDEGHPATDLYPSHAQQPEFLAAHKTRTSLKQTLSAYRVLGPCGLTVLEVSARYLVISFTSVWKTLTHSFILQITDDKDTIKVAGTDIPYFIDVNAMLTNTTVADWPKTMEDIGHLLNAYTQRRREVEQVESDHKTIMRQMSYNDPVTTVDMRFVLTNTTANHGMVDLQIDMTLIYESIHAVYPHKVYMTSSHDLPEEEKEGVKAILKSNPLSDAMAQLTEKLNSIAIDDYDYEEDSSNDESVDS